MCASVQLSLSHLLRVEGIVRQVDLRKGGHRKPGQHGRLRTDRVKIVCKEEQLLLTQLDGALLDGRTKQQLVRSEHRANAPTRRASRANRRAGLALASPLSSALRCLPGSCHTRADEGLRAQQRRTATLHCTAPNRVPSSPRSSQRGGGCGLVACAPFGRRGVAGGPSQDGNPLLYCTDSLCVRAAAVVEPEWWQERKGEARRPNPLSSVLSSYVPL